MIKFNCEHCGQKLGVADGHAGKRVRCSKCKSPVAVPLPELELSEADLLTSQPLAAPAAAAGKACPSCGAGVSSAAVICVSCGYNLREGTRLTTQTGGTVLAATGERHAPRRVHTPEPLGFFGKIAQSWEFAKISYGILWQFKFLLVFPVLSTIAAILVFASFILPMWGMGTLEHLDRFLDSNGQGSNQVPPYIYAVAFLFYFCCYFVIVFFNAALTACAMKAISGDRPTLGYGLSIALKRLPQIFMWALVSALIGVLLKVVENAHEKVGRIIALVLGSAWTVLTYFVVPVLVIEGVGPFAALKRSTATLKDTWGQGLVGHVALGFLSVLVLLPVYLLVVGGLYIAAQMQSGVMLVTVIAVAATVLLLNAAASSAADGVFKALLYNYATGRSIPADVDEDVFAQAFGSRGIGS